MPTIHRIDDEFTISFETTDIELDASIGSFIRKFSIASNIKVEDRKMTAYTLEGEFITSFSWED